MADDEEIGEQRTLEVGDMLGGTPRPRLEEDLVLQAQQARVFGALFRKPVLRRFGRYVVLDVLGQGGMGVVLKGYDEELDRQVAIKVLHRELDEQHTARLRREAQAMAKLSHPNVVQVYEVGELEGQTFVAMELCKGKTVRAWIEQEPRPGWKACVEVFVQLGEGLAAAHGRGLVHRDFKPGNAIVGEDGRARVLDFGLARRGDGDERYAEAGDVPSVIEQVRTDEHAALPLEQSLTRTGTVLGTPAYMPPEQMGGLLADARSDQFSFCVALHEAVYGERPYEGGSMEVLLIAMRSGMVRPAPKGSDVPMALRKVLLRGLATNPEQRWPSMEALLGELRRLVVPRGRRFAIASLVVAILGVGGSWALGQYVQIKDRCTGAEVGLAEIWDEPRKQEVRAAILGTELSYAPGTWERVEERLDAYTEDWASKHEEVCEATSVRNEQSPDVMDLRMGCLDKRRGELRAAVGVLAEADATVVQNAVELVAGLPGFSRCDDLEALRAEIPPPEDPVVAAKVEALDERLVEAAALQNAGQYEEGLRVADEVVKEGEVLEYAPLMARAWLRQGSLRENRGDYEGALPLLKKAYGAAVAHTMTAEAANASVELVFLLGYRLARHEEADCWMEHAEPLSQAVGTDQARSSHFNAVGTVAVSRIEYDQAREYYEQALAIREKGLGPDHLLVAASLNNLGDAVYLAGDYEDARALLERALAIREKALGSDHPDVGSSLGNLGKVVCVQGKYEDARDFYERALAIQEKTLGAAHPEVAILLNNLGNVAYLQADYDRARDMYEQALAIKEKEFGPDHPDITAPLSNLGNMAAMQGKYEDAYALHERALAIQEKALGPDHSNVAVSLTHLGSAAQMQGKHEVARELYERALAVREKALGPDHSDVARPLSGLGSVAVFQGRYEDARELYERALAIREKALGPDHPSVAASLSSLGNVASRQGAYEEAREYHERALAIQEKALGPDHPDVAYTLTGLGEALLGLAKPADALTPLERALTIRTTHEVQPALLAATRFALARALWIAPAAQGRDRPRARTLAEQAHDAYAALGDAKKTERTEVQAWLAKHRLP
ncbi:serine/threonine-protein kinase [Paraliomyxa miuraensis]|uniref:serine/threonine-protein kinase n=1 Tax=Paraliomyxa miuraensis TaxID=376150 RepID=UPI0022540151|nr:serine/threonine-protein kinase [Paraliomyxa miuraensis]MCX4242308.1 serine/threonine-protein kinase [Paraliomyxa miuraensis]